MPVLAPLVIEPVISSVDLTASERLPIARLMGIDEAGIEEDHAGASARREYERRRQRREQHAKDKLGWLGVVLVRETEGPRSTRVWAQGAAGEARTADRLAKHLDGHAVLILHDRRIPHHGRANIDHIVVGPGGVTVIDTKTHQGNIRVDRAGGLLSPRRSRLVIGGRDQTRLIDGVQHQMAHVRTAIAGSLVETVDIVGALCFPTPDGLPLFGQPNIAGVIIDGPKPIAKLARRPGSHSAEAVDRIWRALDRAFPAA